ncbi:MAG: hypothetical protein V1773_04930 [bacterium]
MNFKESFINFLNWFLYSLSVSLVALFLRGLKIIMLNEDGLFSLNLILENVTVHGELLLIAIGSLGVALGELTKDEPRNKIAKVFLVGGILLLLIISVYFFTEFSEAKAIYKTYRISNLSSILMIASFMFAFASFIIPKKLKEI